MYSLPRSHLKASFITVSVTVSPTRRSVFDFSGFGLVSAVIETDVSFLVVEVAVACIIQNLTGGSLLGLHHLFMGLKSFTQ